MKKYTIFGLSVLIIILISSLFYAYNKEPIEIIFNQEIDGEPEMQLIVKAPETCVIGEMVTIDVTASNCDTFEWKVIPETTDFRVITNGQEALFTSRSPGKYIFVIAGTRDGILMPLKVVTVIVKAGTIPVNTFTSKVKSWLPADADSKMLEKLAKSFERVASAGHKEVADLVKITALSNRGILGSSLEEYKPFLIAFSAHLKANYTEATIDKHIELWFNLAAALRSIK